MSPRVVVLGVLDVDELADALRGLLRDMASDRHDSACVERTLGDIPVVLYVAMGPQTGPALRALEEAELIPPSTPRMF